ncbi:unnamed protein product [Triticum turgidum subsp. durum]|uniref:F-box domain-containing protein n=1 Tax=Triticum turgidum subsp. durum TaxID=4567 RepID=A0A9R1PN26_TRITD|nr:unnamed protein product [Triticum turgidum subsp. durum]
MTPPPQPQPQPSHDSLPALPDDLIVEILLRLPPDEPEYLFRASLVCKLWGNLLSGRAFRRRYREFHQALPVLGFFRNLSGLARFVPTTAFRPPDSGKSFAFDCRHGRVLLSDRSFPDSFTLWDPMTNEKQRVRHPAIRGSCYNAGVFCATPGCDHLDCHGGPFLVAFVGTDADDDGARACLYSSETGVWSSPSYVEFGYELDSYVDSMPPVMVGDALYFTCGTGSLILRYNLGGDRGLSVIDAMDVYEGGDNQDGGGVVIMPVENGGLGLAVLNMFTLYLWVLKTGPGRAARWKKSGVIKLDMLSIGDPRHSLCLLSAFAKGRASDVIFVSTHAGVFMIELKSEQVTKVCEKGLFNVFPYMSFCTPGTILNLTKFYTIELCGHSPANKNKKSLWTFSHNGIYIELSLQFVRFT